MQYALIGHPLGHSLSPRLHQLLSRASGREMEYTLLDILPEELSVRLPDLLCTHAGLNVTIPYKQTVIPLLSRLDESAARYTSVNTIHSTGGESVGYNTDCTGFSRSIAAFPEPHSALVVGAGGVGRTFAIELARRGCGVTLGVRASSLARGNALAAEITERFGVPARVEEMSVLCREGGHFDLLANASPCGMFPHTDECPVSETLLGGCAAVFDSIYNPRRTRLLEMAERLGIPALGGMRMLAWQAAAAQEIWTGAHFPEETVEQIAGELEAEL